MSGPVFELASLLLADWLESWRHLFPRHDRMRMGLFVALVSVAAIAFMGGLSHAGFAAIAHALGSRMPAYGRWLAPFLETSLYGWFFLTTIWLGRTYRRRERIIPLLLSPLPFWALSAYVMLRDTGLPCLLLSLLTVPFVLGGLSGMHADPVALAMAVPCWLFAAIAALAMANAVVLLLFRILPAGWEGPMTFATANVLILLLPFLTHGLNTPWMPFYWPGRLASETFLPGSPLERAWALLRLLALALAWLSVVYALTRAFLHGNWSKSEEQVPSRILGRLSFLRAGHGPVRTLVLKDWLLTCRAWGEALIVIVLLGVSVRLRASAGLPSLSLNGAPLLTALLGAWGMIELLAFLGQSHQEGTTTLMLTMSPLSPRQLAGAKLLAIAIPRLLLGEIALVWAAAHGNLSGAQTAIGQIALVTMVATLSWPEVAHSFSGDPDRLGPVLTLWEKFYGFWRLIVIYPGVGLIYVLTAQVAAFAWDQGVYGLTGMILGILALGSVLTACSCELIVRRKLGVGDRPARHKKPAAETLRSRQEDNFSPLPVDA